VSTLDSRFGFDLESSKIIGLISSKFAIAPLHAIYWGGTPEILDWLITTFGISATDKDIDSCVLVCAGNTQRVVRKIFNLFQPLTDEEVHSCMAAALLAENESVFKFLRSICHQKPSIKDEKEMQTMCEIIHEEIDCSSKETWQCYIPTRSEKKENRRAKENNEHYKYYRNLWLTLWLFQVAFGGYLPAQKE
jgi:hypothetical protein